MNNNNNNGNRRVYTAEFKKEAVQLVKSSGETKKALWW